MEVRGHSTEHKEGEHTPYIPGNSMRIHAFSHRGRAHGIAWKRRKRPIRRQQPVFDAHINMGVAADVGVDHDMVCSGERTRAAKWDGVVARCETRPVHAVARRKNVDAGRSYRRRGLDKNNEEQRGFPCTKKIRHIP
jgi:hypothetical protein